MKQLLLISERSVQPNDNRQPGDIVGVYSDSYVFRPHERDIFDIVEVDDSVAEQMMIELAEFHEAGDGEFEEILEEP